MKTDLLQSPCQDMEPEQDTLEQGAETLPAQRPFSALRVAISSAIMLLLLGGGATALWWMINNSPSAQRTDLGTLPPMVKVLTLSPENIEQYFVGYGSARSDRDVLIAAEAAGQVMHVPPDIKDGSLVQEGQTMIQIDDRPYQRKLDQATGELADVAAQLARLDIEKTNIEHLIDTAQQEVDITKGEYDRLTALRKRKLASKKEWDFARLEHQSHYRELLGLQNQLALIPNRMIELSARRNAKQAEVELAKLECEYCTIKAPFSGQIERIMVAAGDRVRIGSELVHIVDTRFIEVPIELPLSVRSKIGPQSACILTMDSLPNVRWKGSVRRIAPVADTQNRTFTAYLEVDNQQQTTALIPGFFLTARVSGPTIRGALAIPRGAIQNDRVFVLNGNKAHLRRVRVRNLLRDRAVVTGDISAGDRIILTNLDILSDGSPVRMSETMADSDASSNQTANKPTHSLSEESSR